MLKDRLIYWLGGYTEEQFISLCEHSDYLVGELENRDNTIRELQALVPVSAVLPKKRGRPRKYAGKA